MEANRPRPLPFDPAREMIQDFLDRASDDAEWWYTGDGDYEAAAVEVMKNDGSGFRRCVLLSLPLRLHGTNETKSIRLLIDPEDATGIGRVLGDTAAWMHGVRRVSG